MLHVILGWTSAPDSGSSKKAVLDLSPNICLLSRPARQKPLAAVVIAIFIKQLYCSLCFSVPCYKHHVKKQLFPLNGNSWIILADTQWGQGFPLGHKPLLRSRGADAGTGWGGLIAAFWALQLGSFAHTGAKPFTILCCSSAPKLRAGMWALRAHNKTPHAQDIVLPRCIILFCLMGTWWSVPRRENGSPLFWWLQSFPAGNKGLQETCVTKPSCCYYRYHDVQSWW